MNSNMTKPIHSATFKARPADFVVTEILPQADNLTGQGEHLWLYIQKQGVNTAYVAKLLSKLACIKVCDVGFSGLKDRHAVTYQWFSLRLPKTDIDLDNFEKRINHHLKSNEHICLIKYKRHHKKLNRGTHKFNHFVIILHDVVGDKACIDAAFYRITTTGMPNYFGRQRFGHNSNNLAKAAQLFLQPTIASKQKGQSNQHDSMLISAVRSHLFNQILDLRVVNGTWCQALDGDVFNLNGTNSLFTADIDDNIVQRVQIGDIHPTAPLFGRHAKLISTKTAHEMEQQILTHPDNALWIDGLSKLNIIADRRALRTMVHELSWQWLDNQTLKLSFALPTGSFATSLLEYLTTTLTEK